MIATLAPLLAMAAMARAALQPYNLSISDESPLISWSPNENVAAWQGWNVSYTDSPAALDTTSNSTTLLGKGSSVHYSTYTGAAATFSFLGTAVYLYGQTSASSAIHVTLDGASANASASSEAGVLASVTDVAWGWHELRVEVVGADGVNITGVTWTTGVGDGSGVKNQTVEALVNGNPNQAITTAGQWSTKQTLGSEENTVPSPRLISTDASSSLILVPPANTSLVVLYGPLSRLYGSYSVRLTPSTSSGSTDIYAAKLNQTFSAYGSYTVAGQVLYAAAIDPARSWSVTLKGGGDGGRVGLERAVFVGQYGDGSAQSGTSSGTGTQNSPTSSSAGGGESGKSNTGAIAGGVIGGLAVLLMLIGGLLILRRRHNRVIRRVSNSEIEQYLHDKPEERGSTAADAGRMVAYPTPSSSDASPSLTPTPYPRPYAHTATPSSAIFPLAPLLGDPSHSTSSRYSQSSFAHRPSTPPPRSGSGSGTAYGSLKRQIIASPGLSAVSREDEGSGEAPPPSYDVASSDGTGSVGVAGRRREGEV